jgi:adenylate kinase family enzyme
MPLNIEHVDGNAPMVTSSPARLCNHRVNAMPNERRILVTGNAGAGKTSVARILATHMGLPYVGLDQIVWQPKWVRTPIEERRLKEQAVANTPSWIVDGVSQVMMQAADTVIFLDYPRYICFWRVFWRNLPYLFRSRPGLPEKCPEIRAVSLLARIIWNFPKLARPKILDACKKGNKRFIHVRSNRELNQILIALGASWSKESLSTMSLQHKPTYSQEETS